MNRIIDTVKRTGQKKFIPLYIYLVLLILAGVLVSNNGGAFFYVLFFSVLLYVPVTLLQMLYTRMFFKIYQEVGDRLLYKNAAVDYQITIENAGIFPIGRVKLVKDELVTDLENDFTTEEYRLLPRESRSIETKISCRYAGGYTGGITKIIISDIFGLMSFSYDIPTPLRVSVLPVMSDIAVAEISRIFESVSHRNVFRLERDEAFPGNEVRDYMPGDPIKNIHWKNYARTGDMSVRLPEKQESGMMNFVIIPDMESTIVRRDYMLEYIVSVSNWFARMGRPVRIFYYYAGAKDYLIENYDTFRTFYFEKLKEFGAVGKQYPDDARDKMMEAAKNLEGLVVIFDEEAGGLVQ